MVKLLVIAPGLPSEGRLAGAAPKAGVAQCDFTEGMAQKQLDAMKGYKNDKIKDGDCFAAGKQHIVEEILPVIAKSKTPDKLLILPLSRTYDATTYEPVVFDNLDQKSRHADVAGLRKALARVIADPVLRLALGSAGRHLWSAQFTASKMAARTVEVYKRALRTN